LEKRITLCFCGKKGSKETQKKCARKKAKTSLWEETRGRGDKEKVLAYDLPEKKLRYVNRKSGSLHKKRILLSLCQGGERERSEGGKCLRWPIQKQG